MASRPAHPNKRFPAGEGSRPIARKASVRSGPPAENPVPHDQEANRPNLSDMRRTLLLAAFPLEYSDSSWLEDTNSTALRMLTSAAAKYRKQLESMPEQDIATQYDSYMKSERQGLFKEANCRRACRLPCWSAEEVAFYSFGLEFPGEVGLEVIRQDKEAIEAEWLDREPAGKGRGSLWIPLEHNFSAHLLDRLDLIRRAIRTNELPEPIQPGQFIRWAERRNIRLPFSLVSGAKSEAAEIEDWRDRYEDAQRTLAQQKLDHRAALDKTFAENTELKHEVARLKDLNDTLIRTGDGPRLRRKTLLENAQKMLICVAREKYGWDKSMDAAARQISAATASYIDGGVGPDAVKNCLEEAQALIDGPKRRPTRKGN